MRAPRSDPRRTIAIAVAVASVPYFLLAARFAFVCDDAYISFRYARHLAEGHGLVFNLGESPPVEGYSNFLWTVWLGIFSKLGIDLAVAANATSIASGCVLLYLCVRFVVRRYALELVPAVASALFFATLPPVVLWATSGLETLPFALACFLAFERLQLDPERPRGAAAGVAALAAALMRVDGVAWAVVVLAAGSLAGAPRSPSNAQRSPPNAKRSSSMRCALAVALAILALGVGAHVAWRLGYHADWLPNTARVKAGLSALRIERGARYLAVFLLSVPSVALALMAAVTGLARRGMPRPDLAWRAGIVLAGTFSYAVFVGGDFMPMGRFLVVGMPFLTILFAGSLLALSRRRAIANAYAALVILLSLLASFDLDFVPRAWRAHFHFRWNDPRYQSEVEQWVAMRARAREWSQVGRALALCTAPGESIVLGGIGAIGYHSELYVYDLFGLVSPEVARQGEQRRASPGHDKGVTLDFFLDREPDYLGAWIAPAGAPADAGLPAGWSQSSLASRTRVEVHPLAPELGLPAHSTLRVLRYQPQR